MERLSCDVVVLGGGTAGCVVAGRLAAESDADAVVLEAGPDYGPRGLDRVFVADCSLMPVVPRANTNVPAVVVGERIADELLA